MPAARPSLPISSRLRSGMNSGPHRRCSHEGACRSPDWHRPTSVRSCRSPRQSRRPIEPSHLFGWTARSSYKPAAAMRQPLPVRAGGAEAAWGSRSRSRVAGRSPTTLLLCQIKRAICQECSARLQPPLPNKLDHVTGAVSRSPVRIRLGVLRNVRKRSRSRRDGRRARIVARRRCPPCGTRSRFAAEGGHDQRVGAGAAVGCRAEPSEQGGPVVG